MIIKEDEINWYKKVEMAGLLFWSVSRDKKKINVDKKEIKNITKV